MLELERQRFLSYNEGVLIGNYVTVNLMLVYHCQSLWTDIRSTWLNFDHKSKEMLSPKNERFLNLLNHPAPLKVVSLPFRSFPVLS